MRRLVTLGVIASWVVMVALLVERQATPPTIPLEAPTGALEERDEWFGVYHEGRKIGHAHRVATRTADGWIVHEDSTLSIAMLGVPQTLRTTLTAETDRGFTLERFTFRLLSPAAVFSADGESDGARLSVTYGTPGQPATLDLPLTEPVHLPSTFRPQVLAQGGEPGARYAVPAFNPLTLRAEPMAIVVEGRETLATPEGPVTATVLAEEHHGVRTRVWIAPDGTVLREEAALGFRLEREPRAVALAPVRGQQPVDLVAASRIPLEGTIAAPRQTTRLVLRVEGPGAIHVPDAPPRQRLRDGAVYVTREGMPVPSRRAGAADAPGPEVARYLRPSPFVESDDPAIVARARAVVSEGADPVRAAADLVRWVGDHVEQAPTATVPSAREVLRSLRGDCNEHAVLLVALARAAGIPARVVAGTVYAGDGFYYHAWAELWLGRWISADAVFGQLPADATHIKLMEGGPERHMSLVGVIGQLRFAVEDVST